MNRRDFLAASTLLAGALPGTGWTDKSWSAGEVSHLIPTANHHRIRLKAIFREPVKSPVLRVGEREIPGVATDSTGHGHAFDVASLAPDTEYRLGLHDSSRTLCDPWPLRTLPAPDAEPASFRLLVYTCAGGHPLMSEGPDSAFLPMPVRQRLLARALSYAPQALIAVGDQVYWDQRTSRESINATRRDLTLRLESRLGTLRRDEPVRGSDNEAVLKVVAGHQITPLYGTTLRSLPSFFIDDDHDWFENDEATDRWVTLPPHHYQNAFAAFVREHYLPEFLPDPSRPVSMSGQLGEGLNRSFGTLRYGRLFEALLYDCAGYLSLRGELAGLVPDEVEAWLLRRTQHADVRQLVHVPGHPFGWTAGKWREWYPDVADTGEGGAQVAQMGVDGRQFRLTTAKPKFMWQRGWWHQHQRLLAALSAQPRPAIVISGDLHATGHAAIRRSAGLDLAANPVHTLLSGPLGTGSVWPSAQRGTPPVTATGLDLHTHAAVTERNGFTLLDVSPDAVRVRLFAWRRELASVEAIDTLEPYHDVMLTRPARNRAG